MNSIGIDGARRRVAICLTLALGATLALASPAEAKIYHTEDYAGTFEESFPFCGIDVDFETEFSGSIRIREGTGPDDDAFFLQDRFSYQDTFTNPANGKFFTISGKGVFQELKATRLEGSIFEFISHEVGQPFVLRDMDGNVVLRDRGAITFRQVFDTLGDDMPGGEELDFEVVRVAGPHPGFMPDPVAQCETVVGLLG